MESLGERLRRVREERGLTQGELGALVHVSDATINRYEKNLRKPTPEMLRQLASVLGVSGDYLLGLSDDPGSTVVRETAAVWLDGGPEGLGPEEEQELRKFVEWLKHRRGGASPSKPGPQS